VTGRGIIGVAAFIALFIAACAATAVLQTRFENRCDRLGGHVIKLYGRDMHSLCLSPDGRLLDQR
jgi:hypothetical protein